MVQLKIVILLLLVHRFQIKSIERLIKICSLNKKIEVFVDCGVPRYHKNRIQTNIHNKEYKHTKTSNPNERLYLHSEIYLGRLSTYVDFVFYAWLNFISITVVSCYFKQINSWGECLTCNYVIISSSL